jgi:hypothetical protein
MKVPASFYMGSLSSETPLLHFGRLDRDQSLYLMVKDKLKIVTVFFKLTSASAYAKPT